MVAEGVPKVVVRVRVVRLEPQGGAVANHGFFVGACAAALAEGARERVVGVWEVGV